MRKIFPLIALFLLLFSCIASAEKYQFDNKDYDASGIDSAVLLVTAAPNANISDPYLIPQLYVDLKSELASEANMKIITMPEVEQLVNEKYNVKLDELQNTDSALAGKYMADVCKDYRGLITIEVGGYNSSPSYGFYGGAMAGFKMDFKDMNTNVLILSRTESRVRQSDFYHAANPQGIASRILKNFVNDINKKIHKNK